MTNKTPNPVLYSIYSDLTDRQLTTQERQIETAINAMDDLCKELDKKGWKYERYGPDVMTEPYLLGSVLRENQVVFYDGDKAVGDAVCKYGSYGYEVGLFEVMGSPLLSDSVTDNVQGWVTEEEIIKRLEKYYDSKRDE